MADDLWHQTSGAVMTITINRPERRNALNASVAAGISAALDKGEADPSVRAIVLTGAEDKAFCAGGDLQLDADGTPFTIEAADPRHYVAGLFRRMRACRLPLVARVNGHALAGGFGLLCACDLAVGMTDRSTVTSQTLEEAAALASTAKSISSLKKHVHRVATRAREGHGGRKVDTKDAKETGEARSTAPRAGRRGGR